MVSLLYKLFSRSEKFLFIFMTNRMQLVRKYIPLCTIFHLIPHHQTFWTWYFPLIAYVIYLYSQYSQYSDILSVLYLWDALIFKLIKKDQSCLYDYFNYWTITQKLMAFLGRGNVFRCLLLFGTWAWYQPPPSPRRNGQAYYYYMLTMLGLCCHSNDEHHIVKVIIP